MRKRNLVPFESLRRATRAKAALVGADDSLVSVSMDFLQDKDEKSQSVLTAFIKKIEKYTWMQVKQTKGFGWETRKPPPKDWPLQVSPDENCIHLRSSKKGRIWGFRDGDKLQVVWVDPDHKLDD